jgi:hypothetical protein
MTSAAAPMRGACCKIACFARQFSCTGFLRFGDLPDCFGPDFYVAPRHVGQAGKKRPWAQNISTGFSFFRDFRGISAAFGNPSDSFRAIWPPVTEED